MASMKSLCDLGAIPTARVIGKTGRKSWVQRTTVDGRRRDIGLGRYPAVPLTQARKRSADNRAAVTTSRAFIRSFVKEIVISPGEAKVRYTLPTPEDSPIGGDTAEIVLNGGVMSMGVYGGDRGTRI